MRSPARWRALDVGTLDVATQIDHRLIGSVLHRVTWELDVLESWRRDPVLHIHQVLQPYFDLLLALAPFDDARAASIVAALDHVPVAVDRAIASLDRPANALRRAALELLDGIGDRVEESVGALTDHLPSASRGPVHTSLAPARVALERFTHHLETLGDETGGEGTAVGEAAFVWFLRNVAVMPETPQELLRTARTEWERAVVWEAVAMQRAAPVSPAPLPASAAEQVAREAEDAAAVVDFYEQGGWLTQPPDLRRYLTAELPAYLAPLSFLGVCDELTDEHRLDTDGVSYVPPPDGDLGYFAAANARDPRAGIVHEGAHYQQLAISNGHPNPVRRRYYDSASNEGIAFYNEEYLLHAGLFDDAPHTRTVIWNFARLRALRVEVDVRLATGSMTLDEGVEYFVRHVPMDRGTAFVETAAYAGNPGFALTYQAGKTQLLGLVAAAVETDREAFSLRRVHDFVWREGNVPFALQRWELLGDRSVLDEVDADPATGAPAPAAAWSR